jgi:hypothetical protein
MDAFLNSYISHNKAKSIRQLVADVDFARQGEAAAE